MKLMLAQQCNVLECKNFELLCDGMFAANSKNHLRHVSKEYVKWLSYLGVEYCSSRESNFWEKIN